MKKVNIEWLTCYGKLSEDRLAIIQNKINILLPKLLVELMQECDAGVPLQSEFQYYDNHLGKNIYGSIGGFLNFCESEWSDFLNKFLSPPEFFPKGLIAFAEVGNGDLICFDYRQDRDNLDPPIVYWNHEADIGKDVSLIAENFEEFLGMLKKPED